MQNSVWRRGCRPFESAPRLKGMDITMAEVATNRYGNTTTYGNLAYDFTTTETFYPDNTYAEPEVGSKPEVKEEVQALPRVRQSFAPTALVGFACAAVMVVFLLMAQIQLVEVSDQTAQLKTALSELQLEQARLLIGYESAFNLTEIEEYAIDVMGMQKPRSDQVFFIDGAAPDKANILQSEKEENGLLDRFSDMIASLGDILK